MGQLSRGHLADSAAVVRVIERLRMLVRTFVVVTVVVVAIRFRRRFGVHPLVPIHGNRGQTEPGHQQDAR